MDKFKVKKNKKFFCGPRWNLFEKNKKEFNIRAYFWKNCVYKLTENYDQINKLTGKSFRIFPWYDKKEKKFKSGHHKNSVRFGWRCIDGEKIEILAYVYINGVRKHKKMLSINPDTFVHLHFKETDAYYIFKVVDEDGITSATKFKKNGNKNGFLGLFINKLYPYFGGCIAAPHNMRIDLKYLKKFI